MTTTTPTIGASRARHVQCTLEQYHARSEWSRSQLEVLRESPPLFHGRYTLGSYPYKRTTALDVGTVAHTLLSSPASRNELVKIIPAKVLNKDGHRKGAPWKAFEKEHIGLILMKAEEFEPVKQMVRNVYAHDEAGRLLSAAIHYEHTLYYKDEETGLWLRARPDLLTGADGRVIIVEYKTTRAVTPREFCSDAYSLGYHRQEAWYWDAVEAFGMDVADFIFITSDKSPAYQCRCYRLPRTALELGRRQNRENRRDLARRLAENDWTDPLGSGIHNVDLPEYAYPPVAITTGGVALEL